MPDGSDSPFPAGPVQRGRLGAFLMGSKRIALSIWKRRYPCRRPSIFDINAGSSPASCLSATGSCPAVILGWSVRGYPQYTMLARAVSAIIAGGGDSLIDGVPSQPLPTPSVRALLIGEVMSAGRTNDILSVLSRAVHRHERARRRAKAISTRFRPNAASAAGTRWTAVAPARRPYGITGGPMIMIISLCLPRADYGGGKQSLSTRRQ